MANYTLDSAKAMMAKERIEASSMQINGLLQQYTQAKQQLLSTWEGSMKDLFIQQTGQHFESNCTMLINNLKMLASNVSGVKTGIINKDITAANIVGH